VRFIEGHFCLRMRCSVHLSSEVRDIYRFAPNPSISFYLVKRAYAKICCLLGYYAASCGNCLPTFRDNVSVPSSRVKSPSRNYSGSSRTYVYMYYICIYVCMYVCTYICVLCMYVRMYVCMYVCMHVCVRMYVCMHVCMYACMCVCMCICMHYVCMYVSIMYVCTQVCTYIPRRKQF
jgi:hypothetical protein